MAATLRSGTLALLLGDLVFLAAALWLALFLRDFSLPPRGIFETHLVAFAPLFLIFVAVFLIAGLYERRQMLLARRALSATLLNAQAANVIIAAIYFFAVPFFGIEPKTILIIYLIVSFLLVLVWRAVLFPRLGLQKPERALVIGSGAEIEELVSALSASRFSPVTIVEHIRPAGAAAKMAVEKAIAGLGPQVVIAEFEDEEVVAALPELYNLLFRGVRFIDAGALYEQLFGRIPLSRLGDAWVARNISRTVHRLYDPMKRVMDIFAALILGLVSLLFYPFIILAILLDGGPVFIAQERVGQDGRPIRLYKFRTMTGNDSGKYQGGATALRVTRAGRILRTLRLDELPQLLNVLVGDLSLIGPRPEFPSLVAQYEKEIPYYGVRHLIKPGLSGWAQLYQVNHPHHAAAVEPTREKLSYDLYYVKHRSLTLDALIMLKTIKKMLTKSGV